MLGDIRSIHLIAVHYTIFVTVSINEMKEMYNVYGRIFKILTAE